MVEQVGVVVVVVVGVVLEVVVVASRLFEVAWVVEFVAELLVA